MFFVSFKNCFHGTKVRTSTGSLIIFYSRSIIEKLDDVFGMKSFGSSAKITRDLKLSFIFDDLKGFHVQYNVVSRETLLDAQKHPEQYTDLIVRVAGYSAFFNVLSRQTQNDIIARTEQNL